MASPVTTAETPNVSRLSRERLRRGVASLLLIWLRGATADMESGMASVREFPWVRDTYEFANILNVGVFRDEKQWDSPMITTAVCARMDKEGAHVGLVRFVDIQQVAHGGKTPRDAEIVLMQCPKPNAEPVPPKKAPKK